MKVWRLVFSRRANADFDAIYGWVADNASTATADRYTTRLRSFCARLNTYPKRGEVHEDLRPGSASSVSKRA